MNAKIKAAVIYIIFAVGITGHMISGLKGYMTEMTPYVLLITSILVLYFSEIRNNKNFIRWFLISYFITLTLEIAGVKTGLVFGSYVYGETLGAGIAGVPLIIGFNWIFVILGCIGIGKKISGNKFITAAAAGVFAVIFDIILEPVAVSLNYWKWTGGEIPMQNYAAWFVITFLITLIYCYLNVNVRKEFFIHYLAAQFLFFLVLGLS
ncbi:MAG: carotenoid biosynthesis protein [Bacteroidetes bacterium]|nr:carotenoid biosynthesis protein [Bacteroidota bacterium]